MAHNDEEKRYEVRIPFQPSTLENIDGAMLEYVKGLDLFCKTNTGFKRAPVVWVSPERAFQSKVDNELRDEQGALIFPIVSVERSAVSKDPNKRGTVWANIPPDQDEKGGSIPVARRINHVKTKNFANKDAKKAYGQLNFPNKSQNPKIVFQTFSIPLPVYIDVTYKVTIRTEYQEQMNDLVTPFITRPGGINYILIKRENHRYEGFVQQAFDQKNNVTDYSTAERSYETTITINVLGYLIGDTKNQEKPFYAIRENAVEVKIPRERVVLQDVLEHEYGELRNRETGLPDMPFHAKNIIVPGAAQFHQAGGSSAVSGDIVTTENINNALNKVFSIREVPTNSITNEKRVGGGATTFTTSFSIMENTETVFVNGLLQTPGVHYSITNNRTIQLVGQWEIQPPRNREEKQSAKDDTLIISYIVG